MKEATFDPARELTLYFRCNRAGSKNFVFTYSDGTAYSFIYDELELNIYKNQGDKKKLISLNHISGISLNSNTVTASITKALSNIQEGEYYWELYRTDLEKTWLTGDAVFHNGKFDGVTTDSTAITITEDGDDINITISEASGSGNLTLANLGTTLQTAASDTPLDADTFNFYDAVDAILKKVSWSNIKATLKTYFDTLYQALTNTPTAIVDGAAISLTTAEHTLSTAQATITVTDSYTGDYCGLRLTLSGISQVILTFSTGTALCAYNDGTTITVSGDNTMTVTGVAGDRVEIHRKKLGTNYTYVGLNVGQ